VTGFLIRRLLWGVVVVGFTAVLAYGMMRVLRPEDYGGQGLLSGLASDLRRVFVQHDLGEAKCPGCPPIREMWQEGYVADLSLLAGSFLFGVTGGLLGGVVCAIRPRSVIARALESLAMVVYCSPVYVLGLGALLLFAPFFGLLPLPYFFEVHTYAPPLQSPWDWLRSLLVPCLIVGGPIAAACLRLTVTMSREAMGEHFVRTAVAKGVPQRRVVRRHAAPSAYPSLASFVGATVPAVVTNVVLVETVFSVPGFFRHTRRALGQVPGFPPGIDPPTLQALALWGAVMIVVVGIVCDLVLVAVDPRIRARGRLG
jgi:peptide/nickel transport system permease protein